MSDQNNTSLNTTHPTRASGRVRVRFRSGNNWLWIRSFGNAGFGWDQDESAALWFGSREAAEQAIKFRNKRHPPLDFKIVEGNDPLEVLREDGLIE